MTYDVIVVGASFAGLSVAGQLRGRVLLIDRLPVGARQTSACATYLRVIEKLNCLDSLERTHPTIYIKTVSRKLTYPMPMPFCTFDYEKFCRLLFDRLDVDFLQARVVGVSGSRVRTDRGTYAGHYLVDCSGWGSVLSGDGRGRAGAAERPRRPGPDLNFGVEALAGHEDDGLAFWFDPKLIRPGFGWVFPVSAGSRIGVAGYGPESLITERLRAFFRRFDAGVSGMHGNFFPSALRPPVVAGRIFAVGDAAGHCLPVTGEGIRTAVYFGEQCGRLIQRVLDGALSERQAIDRYRELVFARRRTFIRLRRLQWTVGHLPNAWLTKLADWAADPDRFPSIMRRYDAIAHPDELTGPIKSA